VAAFARPFLPGEELADEAGARRLPLERMVTGRYRLEQVNDAFADLAAGGNIRGVLQLG
jgi:Zn-dependent alcohol dehydrogenase